MEQFSFRRIKVFGVVFTRIRVEYTSGKANHMPHQIEIREYHPIAEAVEVFTVIAFA